MLASSPDVDCGVGLWKTWLWAAVVFAVLYPFGLLAGLVGLLVYGNRYFDELQFATTFGFLAGKYRLGFFFYESVVTARKLAVSLCLTFVTASGYIQAGAALVGLAFFFAVHVRAKPYEYVRHNALETACSLSVEFVLLAGIMFQDRLFSLAVKDALVLLLLVLLLGCIVASTGADVHLALVQLRGATGSGSVVDKTLRRRTAEQATIDTVFVGAGLSLDADGRDADGRSFEGMVAFAFLSVRVRCCLSERCVRR